MPSPFATAVDSHHAALQRVAGVDAVYMHEGQGLEIRGVIGNPKPEEFGDESEAVIALSWDWIVEATELELDGVPFLPVRGEIIEADGVRYEVVHRGNEEPYRHTSGARAGVRIYTVEVEG